MNNTSSALTTYGRPSSNQETSPLLGSSSNQSPSPGNTDLVLDTIVTTLQGKFPIVKTLNDTANAVIAGSNLSDNIRNNIAAGQSPLEAYVCQTTNTLVKEGTKTVAQGAIVDGIPEYLGAAVAFPPLALTIPVVAPLIPQAYQGAEVGATMLGNGAESLCHQTFAYAQGGSSDSQYSGDVNGLLDSLTGMTLKSSSVPYQPYCSADDQDALPTLGISSNSSSNSSSTDTNNNTSASRGTAVAYQPYSGVPSTSIPTGSGGASDDAGSDGLDYTHTPYQNSFDGPSTIGQDFLAPLDGPGYFDGGLSGNIPFNDQLYTPYSDNPTSVQGNSMGGYLPSRDIQGNADNYNPYANDNTGNVTTSADTYNPYAVDVDPSNAQNNNVDTYIPDPNDTGSVDDNYNDPADVNDNVSVVSVQDDYIDNNSNGNDDNVSVQDDYADDNDYNDNNSN